MSKQRFLLSRFLEHSTGDRLLHPMAVFHEQKDAQDGSERRKAELDQLLQCAVVQPLNAQGGQELMTVKQFLFDYMGFKTVGYMVQPIPEHMTSEILVMPEKKIIMS